LAQLKLPEELTRNGLSAIWDFCSNLGWPQALLGWALLRISVKECPKQGVNRCQKLLSINHLRLD
jgi:hypothetical protein